MNDVQAWAVIVGVVLPLVVSVVNQPSWAPLVKRIVSVAAAVVVGVGDLWVNGKLDGWNGHLMVTLALVIGASQAAYNLIWKPSGQAEVIENATSPKPAEVPAVAPEVSDSERIADLEANVASLTDAISGESAS